MSFGLRHLIGKLIHHAQPIGGWYYLLSQHLGDRKHLLAEPLTPDKGIVLRLPINLSACGCVLLHLNSLPFYT